LNTWVSSLLQPTLVFYFGCPSQFTNQKHVVNFLFFKTFFSCFVFLGFLSLLVLTLCSFIFKETKIFCRIFLMYFCLWHLFIAFSRGIVFLHLFLLFLFFSFLFCHCFGLFNSLCHILYIVITKGFCPTFVIKIGVFCIFIVLMNFFLLFCFEQDFDFFV
jgi:hypothetical protein